MAASGVVCGVSFRNTRGGVTLARPRDDAVAVLRLDRAAGLDHQLRRARALMVTRCTTLPNPSLNCSVGLAPGRAHVPIDACAGP